MILSKVKNVVLDAAALTCFKKKPKELYALLDKNKSSPISFTWIPLLNWTKAYN